MPLNVSRNSQFTSGMYHSSLLFLLAALQILKWLNLVLILTSDLWRTFMWVSGWLPLGVWLKLIVLARHIHNKTPQPNECDEYYSESWIHNIRAYPAMHSHSHLIRVLYYVCWQFGFNSRYSNQWLEWERWTTFELNAGVKCWAKEEMTFSWIIAIIWTIWNAFLIKTEKINKRKLLLYVLLISMCFFLLIFLLKFYLFASPWLATQATVLHSNRCILPHPQKSIITHNKALWIWYTTGEWGLHSTKKWISAFMLEWI